MIRPPPRSTRTDTLFPYTTLFRSDPAGVASLVATTGPVDVLVNNAGVPPGFGLPAPFVATTPEDWRPWMALNVDAVMRLCHGYLGGMQAAGWGRILTIVSDAGRTGEPGQVVYGAAKAAAMGLSRGIRVEGGAGSDERRVGKEG